MASVTTGTTLGELAALPDPDGEDPTLPPLFRANIAPLVFGHVVAVLKEGLNGLYAVRFYHKPHSKFFKGIRDGMSELFEEMGLALGGDGIDGAFLVWLIYTGWLPWLVKQKKWLETGRKLSDETYQIHTYIHRSDTPFHLRDLTYDRGGVVLTSTDDRKLFVPAPLPFPRDEATWMDPEGARDRWLATMKAAERDEFKILFGWEEGPRTAIADEPPSTLPRWDLLPIDEPPYTDEAPPTHTTNPRNTTEVTDATPAHPASSEPLGFDWTNFGR